MEIVEATAPPAGTAPAGSATVLADHPCIGWTYAYGSTGCFQAYGDVIWAMDTKADGMSAAVIVNTNYGRAPYACVNSMGNGTSGRCDKDYWESGDVRLQVLRYDYDTKNFYQPEAWSGWLPVDGQ
ncbi:hypothetical protein ACIQUY_34590 [Streptomyces sp. NPDC090231]|uniref:hypothetical protein n=1 Tax=unclassified Streptomyces TaxID=2593676 RepID=UPI002E157F1E